MFDKNKFISFMLEHEVVGTFDKAIQLKSGRHSNWYVNWRNVAQDVYALDLLCEQVLDFCKNKDINVETFYGVPEGASKLGMLCQYKHAQRSGNLSKGSHVLSMGRGKAKEHGNPKDQYFLGLPRGKTLVLEDVTTTGMSLIAAIKQLKEAKVDVIGALALTNRMDDPSINVKQLLADLEVPYICMSTGKDVAQEFLLRHEKNEQSLSKSSVEEFKALIAKLS